MSSRTAQFRSSVVPASRRASALSLTLLAAMTAASAQAADVVKANNTTALNLTGSWVGGVAPTSSDVAFWNNTVTGNNTVAIGADLSWQGIKITNVGGTANQSATTAGVQITSANSTNTLTLGTAGINMSAATQALLIQSKIALSGNQTWNIANANTNNAPFAGGGVNSSLGEDLMFTAQAAATAMNLGGFTLTTSGNGSIGATNGYAISNGTLNLGNANTWFQSGSSRATTLANTLNVNVGANSNLRLRANSGGVTSAAAIGVSGSGAKLQLEINNSGVTMAQSGALTFGNGTTFENILSSNGGMTVGAISATGNVGWNVTGNTANANGIAVSGNLTGSGTVSYQNTATGTDGQVRLSGNNSGFTGTLNLNGGSGNRNLRLTSANAGSANATWTVGTGNTLQVDGVAVNLGTISGSGTITNSHATNAAGITIGSGSFSGAITNGTPANGMALTKTGSGTLTLSGSNTYTGATNVNGGTLATTTAQTGGGAFSVADTASLGITQNSAGATFSSSTLTLAGGSTLSLTPAASPSASVITAPTFNVDGASTLRVNGTGLGSTTLVDYTGSIGGASGFAGLSLALPFRISGDLTNDTDATAVKLTNVQVNTPKWTGASDSAWDVTSDATGNTGATANWQTSASLSSTRYVEAGAGQVDSVILDDSASGSTAITLNTTVSPVSIAASNASKDYSISGAGSIAGTGSLAKSGSAALTLATNNSYSGGTTLNAGALNVNHANALGSGALTVAGGVLDNTSGSAVTATNAQNWNADFAFTGTNDLTLGAASLSGTRAVNVVANTLAVSSLGGTGALTKDGSGTLAVGTGGYTGATTVNAGTLRSTATNSFTSSTSITLANTAGANLDLNGFANTLTNLSGGGASGGNVSAGSGLITVSNTANSTFAGSISGSGGLSKTGSAQLTLSGDKSGFSGPVTISGGTLDAGTLSGAFGTGNITGSNTVFFQANGSTTTGITGGSSGFGARGGNLTINVGGAGATIALNSAGNGGLGQMNFGSATSDSKVIIENGISINNFNGTRTFTVNTGTGTASAEITGVVTNGVGNGDTGINKQGTGDLILSAANTITGNTTIGAGRIVLGNNQALQFTSLNTDNAGRVGATGFTTPTIGGLSGSTALGTFINSGYSSVTSLTLAPQTGRSLTYTGTIADGSAGMNLVKSGAGTQTFNAAQTYTGTTTISGGTLALGANGSLATSSAIINNATFDVSAVTGGFTVGAAQTLGGSGTVIGAVTVNGNLAPGTSPGVLTFNSPLTLAGTTTFEINGLTRGTEYDGVNTGSGLLTYGGSLNLNFGAATSDGATYNLFTIGAGGQAGTFSSVGISGSYSIVSSAPVAGVWTGSGGGYTFTFTEATGILDVVSAIPEPSAFAALAGLGALGLVGSRRRRRA